jgi:putative hydrolase of HD superfamily
MTFAHPLIDLGRLTLMFGRVDRITYHEDGETPESDTDHTVMLGLIGCAFAARHLPMLDLGLVAQSALVHDLVEVYAGDTPTLRINDAERVSKQAREQAAVARIEDQFAETLPWVPAMIDSYEQRLLPEARYVKALDKLLPKITHILNGRRTIREQGMDRDELAARYALQGAELLGYAADFPPLFELREELIAMVMAADW